MATTTNYSWSTPDNTSYVKDGAQSIRTLGSSVDTSMFAALSNKPAMGLLLNTTSFTNVTSVTVDNVFSTSYDNYLINYSWDRVSGSPTRQYFEMLKNSDGLALAATYRNGQQSIINNGIGLVNLSGTTANYGIIGIADNDTNSWTLQVKNPQSGTTNTNVSYDGGCGSYRTNGTTYVPNGATKLRGIRLYPDTGNVTGTVRVYGFRNS